MFKPEESKIFIEEAMRCKDNLEIAVNAHQLFNEIRKTVVLKFVSNLIESIKLHFNGLKQDDVWKIENTFTDKGFKQYSEIAVFKESWGGKYRIIVSADKDDLREFGYGVQSTKENHIQSLADELNETYGIGEENSFVWTRSFEGPYRSWWHEALLNMHVDNPIALNYFRDIIVKICKLSEPIIDKELGYKA